MNPKKLQKGCIISIIILLVLIVGLFVAFKVAFGEDKYQVEIEQDVGGILICDVTYSADLQSWYYFIKYKYLIPNGQEFDFGTGIYNGVDWDENDQLFKFENCTILPTESDFNAIKIIALDLNTTKRIEFKIDSHSIEEDSLWQSQEIGSLRPYSPSFVVLDTIYKNKILVNYTFRVDPKQVDKLDSRKIEYQIDFENGKPNMLEIKNSE